MYLELLHNVEVAIKKSNKKIELQICNDSEEIWNDGIRYMPSLKINNRIVTEGKVLSVEQLLELINKQ